MTHISGIALTIGEFVIQRCSLCGAILCDNRNTAMPCNEDGSKPIFPTWPVGRLIHVETGNPTCYTLLEDSDKLPEDSCIEMI